MLKKRALILKFIFNGAFEVRSGWLQDQFHFESTDREFYGDYWGSSSIHVNPVVNLVSGQKAYFVHLLPCVPPAQTAYEAGKYLLCLFAYCERIKKFCRMNCFFLLTFNAAVNRSSELELPAGKLFYSIIIELAESMANKNIRMRKMMKNSAESWMEKVLLAVTCKWLHDVGLDLLTF